MTQPTTTRRDMLRLSTSAAAYAVGAAIVTGGVALASGAQAAPPAVSPELIALIAAVERREARQCAFAERVYDPAADLHRTVDAETPHVEVDAPHGATWSTAEHGRVGNARMWTSKDRPLVTANQREQFDAMRRLVAAHDERQANIDQRGNRARLSRACEIDDLLSDRVVTAVMAVESFEPANLTDLHAKLAYLVPRGWMSDMGGPERMLADVARLLGEDA